MRSTFQQRHSRKEETKSRAGFFSITFVVLMAVAAFILSGLVMENVNLYKVLGLYDFEVPFVKVPGSDLPELVLQLMLAVLIFFLLQPLIVIVAGLFSRKDKDYDQAPPNPW